MWSHYYTCVESLLYMCGVIIIHVLSHYYTCVESLLYTCGVIIIHVWTHYYTCVESLLNRPKWEQIILIFIIMIIVIHLQFSEYVMISNNVKQYVMQIHCTFCFRRLETISTILSTIKNR